MNIEAEDFPPDIAAHATSLQVETGRCFDRLKIVTALADAIGSAVQEVVCESGLGSLRGRWEGRSEMAGREVKVLAPQEITGVARGISMNGGLLIETSEGVVEVRSGEVFWS